MLLEPITSLKNVYLYNFQHAIPARCSLARNKEGGQTAMANRGVSAAPRKQHLTDHPLHATAIFYVTNWMYFEPLFAKLA